MRHSKSLPVISIKDACSSINGESDFLVGRHEEMGKPYLQVAHKHDFYLLLIIDKGAGSHTIDFKRYDVKNKMVFFLSPGQPHQWDLREDTTGYQVMFSPRFLAATPGRWPYFNHPVQQYLQLSVPEYDVLNQELKLLEKEAATHDSFTRLLFQHRLLIILTLLNRWYNQGIPQVKTESGHRVFIRFLDLLESHFQEHTTVQFYASKLLVTPNYLNIVCKKISGNSAGECIRNRILLEAKRLLALTLQDIKEIAFTLNFRDTDYFSRFFKKYSGQTPTDFRRQL